MGICIIPISRSCVRASQGTNKSIASYLPARSRWLEDLISVHDGAVWEHQGGPWLHVLKHCEDLVRVPQVELRSQSLLVPIDRFGDVFDLQPASLRLLCDDIPNTGHCVLCGRCHDLELVLLKEKVLPVLVRIDVQTPRSLTIRAAAPRSYLGGDSII